MTVNFGFHRRSSVLDVQAGGLHNAAAVYDAARIAHRARLIGYGIDARRQRFHDEMPFAYAPHAGEVFRWDAAVKAGMTDYNMDDLSI